MLNLTLPACITGAVGKLLVGNLDYLVDGMCARLRALDAFPRAPDLVEILIRYSGQPTAPLLRDTIGVTFAMIDGRCAYDPTLQNTSTEKWQDQTHGLLRVLRTIACSLDTKCSNVRAHVKANQQISHCQANETERTALEASALPSLTQQLLKVTAATVQEVLHQSRFITGQSMERKKPSSSDVEAFFHDYHDTLPKDSGSATGR